MAMSPKQALTIIENIKRDTGGNVPVLVANTIAIESAQWAMQSLRRDSLLLEETKKTNRTLLEIIRKLANGEKIEMPVEPTPAETPVSTNGADVPHVDHSIDPETLKDDDLEKYMDAATDGLPANADAPAPTPLTMNAPATDAQADVPMPASVAPAAPPKATKPATRPAGSPRP